MTELDINAFWQTVLRQDAAAMRPFFDENARICWHCTDECFTLEQYIRANCEYPGDWDGTVERVEPTPGGAVTVTHVMSKDGKASFHVTSFFTIQNGRILSLDEYWADDGSAPAWRREKHIGTPIERRTRKQIKETDGA